MIFADSSHDRVRACTAVMITTVGGEGVVGCADWGDGGGTGDDDADAVGIAMDGQFEMCTTGNIVVAILDRISITKPEQHL